MRYVNYCTGLNFSEPRLAPVDRALVDPNTPARTVVFPVPLDHNESATAFPCPVVMPAAMYPGSLDMPVPAAQAAGRDSLPDLNRAILWTGGLGLTAAGLGWLGNRLAHSAGGGL